MSSLPDHVHGATPVVNVWLCRLVDTCTVAALPSGLTEIVKVTVGPLADDEIVSPFIGPYAVTGACTSLSQGSPAVLPLQSWRRTVTACPLGRPLMVSVTTV